MMIRVYPDKTYPAGIIRSTLFQHIITERYCIEPFEFETINLLYSKGKIHNDVIYGNKLPKMLDTKEVLRRNTIQFARIPRDIENPDYSIDVSELNERLTMTLSYIFNACGGLDLWNLVQQGKLMVSGRLLLYLLNVVPSKWDGTDLNKLSIELFPTQLACRLMSDGNVLRHMCQEVYNINACRNETIELKGFTQSPQANMDCKNSYIDYFGSSPNVWVRTASEKDYYSDSLPFQFRLVCEDVDNVVRNPLSFLRLFYSGFRLFLRCPHSLSTDTAIVKYTDNVPKYLLDHYRSLGYIIPRPVSNRRPVKIKLDFNIPGRKQRYHAENILTNKVTMIGIRTLMFTEQIINPKNIKTYETNIIKQKIYKETVLPIPIILSIAQHIVERNNENEEQKDTE